MATRALTRDQLEQLDSMWKSPGFIATLVAVASAFGSWSMLLPVVPLHVLGQGGSDALAGATTGIFMLCTVLTQIATPQLLRRFGYVPVMVISALLLGVPSALYAFSIAPVPVLLISGIRGVGFGALTVAESALIAELVPMRFLGKASGMLGLTIGLVEMAFMPLGIYLANTFSFSVVYVTGSLIGLVAGVMCAFLPRIKAAETAPEESASAVPAAATWKLVTVPAVAMCTAAMGFGAISSFLAAAVKEQDPATGAVVGGLVLSVVGGAQMLSRYTAGVIADRRAEAGTMLIGSQVLIAAGLGMIAIVLALGLSPWLMLVAALLFGIGFGAGQNEVLLLMFARLPRSRVSDASALWNISFDSGTGLGSAVLGVVAGHLAYTGAYTTATLLVVFALLLAIADKVVGRHRIAEHNNTRAQLRRVPAARAAVRGTRSAARRAKAMGKAGLFASQSAAKAVSKAGKRAPKIGVDVARTATPGRRTARRATEPGAQD
ncbi:MFS transporter [Corynebacterium sp. 13CS0277]|uniref:MFS transporter n=1 Tax=Corynebacterium sp. 13CS0277 TaxID=2071994 RepID=UPI000D025EA3|nr:MFS transporter [Corynebacterium sp. 13CS0277]PRQ12511.1 MFS transporter [Corynebacterium sp. 13CS0277]